MLEYRILVVEDNQLNRELLCDWLEVEGYESGLATDLKASYEFLRSGIPMPSYSISISVRGRLDLVAWMRPKTRTREIPVIAVTAHALSVGAGTDPAGWRQSLSSRSQSTFNSFEKD